MSARYKLIRDQLIYNYPEQRLEVCEDRQEIIKFGIKELVNQAIELESEDFRNLDIIVDMIELIGYLSEISYINEAQIEEHRDSRFDDLGTYSKYLLKIED